MPEPPRQLDRSIILQLDHPDDTPSRKHGILAHEERCQRLHGIGLLHDAAIIIDAPRDVFRTASVIFHRSYHQTSLREIDVWSMAMGSMALGCKVEEMKISFRELVVVFNHLYRKRILCLVGDDDTDRLLYKTERVCGCDLSRSMTLPHKKELLRRSMTPLSPHGPIYEAWHDALVQTERQILRQMGFTLYWISDSHPHHCIDRLCDALSLTEETVKSRAHEACDRTYYIDACVRFPATTIARAAVFVACQIEAVQLLPEWTKENDSGADQQDVSDLCNWILGVSDASNDAIVSTRSCYLRSHVPNGSFNDPGGLVWDYTVEVMGKS
jgi:cyclin L